MLLVGIFGKRLVVSKDNFVPLSNGGLVASTEVHSLQLRLCGLFFFFGYNRDILYSSYLHSIYLYINSLAFGSPGWP